MFQEVEQGLARMGRGGGRGDECLSVNNKGRRYLGKET